MNFDDDGFTLTQENTTLEEQNETIDTETGAILPEICGDGKRTRGREAGRVFSEMAEQDL